MDLVLWSRPPLSWDIYYRDLGGREDPQSLMSWQRAAELSTFSVVVVAEAIATETASPPTVTSIGAAAASVPATSTDAAAAVAASAVAAGKLTENSTCAPKRYSC